MFEIQYLLRRTVEDSADPLIGSGKGATMNQVILCKTKIPQFGNPPAAAVFGKNDVLRLDVTMDVSLAMKEGESVQRLSVDLAGFANRQNAVEVYFTRAPFAFYRTSEISMSAMSLVLIYSGFESGNSRWHF